VVGFQNGKREEMFRGFLRLLWEGTGALVQLAWWALGLFNWRALRSLVGRSLREAFWFLARLTGVLIERTLPERASRGSRRRRYVRRVARSQQAGLSGSPLLIGLGLAVPLFVVMLGALGYFQAQAFQGRQFERFVGQARIKLEQAQGRGGEAEKLLQEAKQAAGRASGMRPNDREAEPLLQEVQDRLDSLLGIGRLYWLPQLGKLSDAASPWAEVLALKGKIYVLEGRAGGRLWELSLNQAGDALGEWDEEAILLEPGEDLGQGRVGRLVDLAWDGEGLAVLDGGGGLYRLREGLMPEVLHLEGEDAWQRPLWMASLGSSLLLLDAEGNRILKYAAHGSDYGKATGDYLQPETVVRLQGAQDMAADGQSVYVLLGDGMVLKFWNGLRVAFELKGLRTPLVDPVAIYASPTARQVYIADRGNGRIVELAKDGTFRREYRPREGVEVFEHLEGFCVDEAGGRLYALSKGVLYLAVLPQEAGG
jgi:hypothetical protein